MSEKVRIMSNSLTSMSSLILAIAVILPLAGCVASDLALDDGFQPYTPSERFPIKVVNGQAVTKKCGVWTENVANTASNTRMPNHGCAMQANLAALVANPEDLEGPQPITPGPAANDVSAIQKINNGQSTNDASRSFFSFF